MAIIETRTILNNNQKQICYNDFLVKDYQRGYRWEEKQIYEFLNDINEFNSNGHTIKYCMQPLVVKKIDRTDSSCSLFDVIKKQHNEPKSVSINQENYYELIDGQQRLTTALLVLYCAKPDRALPYSISYSLIRPIDDYYINEAISCINKWFSQFELREDDVKYEIMSKINNDIEFIWYEVDASVKSVDVFTKLNIGKIPLTNAELFKAVLMNDDFINNTDNDKMILTEIGIEWNYVEKSLRDDEFWGFLYNKTDDGDKETRIDFLLKLYASSHKDLVNINISEDDPLFSFLIINELIKRNKSSIDYKHKIWEEIVLLHDKLKHWFNDSELFHYIGFLIYTESDSLSCIKNLINLTINKKKSEIKDIINKLIKDKFENVIIDNLDYHKDKTNIRNILLFFNLYTMVKSKTNAKFSFKEFKEMSWNIEHIHSQADDAELRTITSTKARKDLLNSLRSQFSEIDDNGSIVEIDNFIAARIETNLADSDEFVVFYTRMVDKYGDFHGNGIGNLALLDEKTNKSYGNALFPVKRETIIQRDMGEVFIPVCTKNVFLKMYSKNPSNMKAWNLPDADDYVNAIKTALITEAKICQ